MQSAAPIRAKERFVVLDALRGFALLGICLANYPEFSLYSFLNAQERADMGSASVDYIIRYLECVFVDGKFYTLFSVLFGIGFAIILENAAKRGADGIRIFYRRMAILLVIGLCHLMLLWSGDILALYAILGMTLPLFRKLSNRMLIVTSGLLLCLPIAIDMVVELTEAQPAKFFYDRQWHCCGVFGINESNFAYWLQEHESYGDVLKFLVQGACERMTEFIDGNRYFKVLGLFLFGLYIGRNRLFAKLKEMEGTIKKIAVYCLAIGIPMSCIYAYSVMNDRPWGLAIHTCLYTLSVFPMGLAYISLFSLAFGKMNNCVFFKALSYPGRMALSNYIGQTVAGMLLFYGIGLGMGADIGLVYVVGIAIGVYAMEIAVSYWWLRRFRYGLLEWLWRMMTYGKYLEIRI